MRREMGPRSMSLPRGTSLHSSLCPSRVQPVSGVLGLTTPPTPPSTSATSSSGENLDQDELVSCTKGTLTGLQLLVKKDLTFTEKRSVQRNCGCVEITHHCKQTKRKKFHPFRAVRKIFRWGSKVKRVKCSEGVSSEGGGIVTSKKSLSVGELRQAALGDPLDPNMDLDDHSIDINDPTGLAVGSGAGCGVAAGAGPGAGLYSMAGLSLSHDSVFSPDTSTPAEMGQIIHPVPVMTGISITNSLFKNELFNRVRARQAGEEDSDEEEDEDPGLPRSPCSHTPPNAGEHASEGGLLLPCGGVIGSDGRVPGTLGTHAGQHPLTGSIASILQHSSPGNKAKARSTCSAGSLSSMLSSETDEDSLSAGASNSQHSSVGVSGGGQSSGSAVGGGGVDKGGQMSHNAARHKIAIKPKKNHGRRRPVRATPTEPSLPATPEERTTPSTADDEAAIPAYNNQSLSNSNSTAELLDIEGPNGKELNNPIQIDEVVVADVRESIKSLERRKQCSPTGLNSIQSGVPSTIITQGPSVLVAGTMPAVVNVAGRMSPAYFLHQQQQQQQQQQHHNQHQHYSSVTTSMVSATSNDPAVDHQGSRADAPTSPPATSPCQTSMPPNPFVQARIYKGARRREIDDEKDDKVTLAGNGAGQSSAFAGSGAKMGLAGTAGVAERPRSELLEGVELRRPRSVQTRLSPDDACGSAQPNLQQQQTTTSSFAGEPELFKVFARRSLKQKPGPHVEKQDTEMETEKLVARQQENNDKDQAREGKVAGNNNINKSTIPQVRSVTDAKRISEPSAGQGIDHSAPAGLLSGPNLTSVELLPSKKELNKLKIGANVISSKDKNKESLVASNQETGGSVLELRREADQFRRQQSLAQPPMSHQPEPISPGGRVGQGSSRSLHMSAPIGQTGGSQHQTGETKRISAVLLQRASSVAVRGTEENAQENEQARTGTGTQGSDQPEWLQLAQKKREKRELQEKMDNTSMGVSNAAKVQDSASNNRLSSSNNFVNSQEASSAKPSAGLRSSKVLDLVSNFQKLQMA
ncbi:uncharacterized protein LOC111243165 isoform X8 [Varroa destructor]|uniref:Uncharacterized protein n=1 Tax=Varroa destructor TaxID=109461 RepID=A0A7M7IXT6_VARDE|nr:uncharacterized protein LOC111243165 isoform X8 [Varroa destructor]